MVERTDLLVNLVLEGELLLERLEAVLQVDARHRLILQLLLRSVQLLLERREVRLQLLQSHNAR